MIMIDSCGTVHCDLNLHYVEATITTSLEKWLISLTKWSFVSKHMDQVYANPFIGERIINI